MTDSSVASWLDKEAFMLCILYMFPCDVARPAGPGGRTPMTWFGRDGSRIIVPITIVGLRACSAEMGNLMTLVAPPDPAAVLRTRCGS